MNTSYEVLNQLNIKIKNEQIIFNKIDLSIDPVITRHECKDLSKIFISANQPSSKSTIIRLIEEKIAQFKATMTFTIPFNRMNIYSLLHKKSRIITTEHLDTGIKIVCEINEILGTKIMAQLHKVN